MSDRPAPTRLAAILPWAATLVAAAAAGFIAYRLTSDRPIRSRATPVAQLQPATLPQPVSAAPEPSTANRRAIPERLPAIALPGLDGVDHRIAEWGGKPLVVNFWATWCDPCLREIPLLEQLRREHAADGLEVIGIAVDHHDAVQQYAKRLRIDYPLLVGEQGALAAANALGMDIVLPFSVFTDRSGRIVTVKVGELHRDEAELILGGVREVDSGRLTLEAARLAVSEGASRLSLARHLSTAPDEKDRRSLPDQRNSAQ